MKFKDLDETYQTMLLFNAWIMYTIEPKREDEKLLVDYYNNYANFRHWCVEIICKLHGLYDSIPIVNSSNESLVFEKCYDAINLKEFKNIKTYNFKIETRGGKICTVR